MAFGSAKTDSIFEIGSITQTFMALTLAGMVSQKKVTLNQPVRELLPAGWVAKPDGPEISLLDLATHHSGLPRLAENLKPRDLADPYADDGPDAFISSRPAPSEDPESLRSERSSHRVPVSQETGQCRRLRTGSAGRRMPARSGKVITDAEPGCAATES